MLSCIDLSRVPKDHITVYLEEMYKLEFEKVYNNATTKIL
jgi:TorA maturation chaperone TorD